MIQDVSLLPAEEQELCPCAPDSNRTSPAGCVAGTARMEGASTTDPLQVDKSSQGEMGTLKGMPGKAEGSGKQYQCQRGVWGSSRGARGTGELLVCTGAQRGTGCVPVPARGPDSLPSLQNPAPGHQNQPWEKGLDQPDKDFLTVPCPRSPGSSWGLCHSPQRVASVCSHSSGCSEPPRGPAAVQRELWGFCSEINGW